MEDKLVPESDSILTTRCKDWIFENPPFEVENLITRMEKIMRQESGVGLSANQIGIDTRLFIMDFDDQVTACFNPEIIEASDELIFAHEGCLSFPDLELKVRRPARLTVKYQDRTGNKVQEILTDLKARCFAHETDHLNGIRFTDRVSRLAVQMAKKRRTKLQRNFNGR